MIQLALLVLLHSAGPAPAGAQALTRPASEWRTVATEHFDVHYPAEMERWTLDVATRLDAVYDAVSAIVGFTPDRRITVVVEDPYNISNGFALPFRDAPFVFLHPTPPEPFSVIDSHRGWGELLAVHEVAHIVHMTRPSRNAWQSRLWRLSPFQLGPITRRSPRWLYEGYATVIEGALTGHGRPNSASRAAILRQMAIEGQLPSYAQLSGAGTFQGQSMAYLGGSAYLEWLAGRRGDSSLVHLWRRMTARQDRGFVPAFEGVFGAPPAELYGRFTAELTGQSLGVAEKLAVADGELFQRRTWSTGDPAISPDGSLLAASFRSRDDPPRLVVMRTGPEPDSDAIIKARAEALRLDPLDVPAVRERPAPRRPVATLPVVNGSSHEYPRWFADGQRVLVTRNEPLRDGAIRPDLFIWNHATGDIRRVTSGAGVRDGDPSPDGLAAAGIRCAGGICDLVDVDIASGDVRVIAAGSPGVSYSRPRWSPDGRELLVARQAEGRWRIVRIPAEGGAEEEIGNPDSASRYDADWSPDARSVIATSERGGIAHLMRIDIASGAELTLTRPTGASFGADAGPGGQVHYLSLHSRGFDLRTLRADSVVAQSQPKFGTGAYPAVPHAKPAATHTFRRATLSQPRPYGLGPRRLRLLPGGSASPSGDRVTLMLHGADPIGRLGWILQGGIGDAAAWRGGALAARWRGGIPEVKAELFATRQRPSLLRDASTLSPVLDADYHGGHLAATLVTVLRRMPWSVTGGLSAGSLDAAGFAERGGRQLAYMDATGGALLSRGDRGITQTATVHAAIGNTIGSGWGRMLIDYGITARIGGRALNLAGTYGTTARNAPAFEQFAVGGIQPPFFDARLLSQRISMPALPPGLIGGRQVAALRASVPIFGLEPFFWTGSAGDRLDSWHRVAGAEFSRRFPAYGFATMPASDIRIGVAHSLDEPFRNRTRAYASVVFRP